MNYIISLLFHSNNPGIAYFSKVHLEIMLSVVLLGMIIVRFKEDLRNNNKHQIVGKTLLLTVLIIQQILLYSWYIFTGNFTIRESLPLYPCRISELLCIILLIKMNDKYFDLLFYWGFSGAIMALLNPDTSNLGFPNAMFIQFFLGHIGIILTILFLGIIYDYTPTKKSLLNSYKISMLYILIVIILNKITGGNYAYLAVKPQNTFFDILPEYPYFIPVFVGGMFLLFAVMNYLWLFVKGKLEYDEVSYMEENEL